MVHRQVQGMTNLGPGEQRFLQSDSQPAAERQSSTTYGVKTQPLVLTAPSICAIAQNLGESWTKCQKILLPAAGR